MKKARAKRARVVVISNQCRVRGASGHLTIGFISEISFGNWSYLEIWNWPHARSMYFPVRVSILTFSPVLMKSGT